MSIKVNMKMNKGKIRELSESSKTAIAMTAEQLRTELINERLMPFYEGVLQNNNTFVDRQAINRGEVSIVHDTPYAARLYHHPEYNFDRTKNTNAGGEWWGPWLEGSKKSRPAALFRMIYKKLTGG